MRNTTVAQDAALAATTYGVFFRIEVQNADGTWIDLSTLGGFDWQVRVEYGRDIDRVVPEARISLARDREDGTDSSLAPLRADSPLNVDDLSAYAPLLDAGRGLRIDVAVMAAGSSPSGTDWVRDFEGEIDSVAWESDPIEVLARAAISSEIRDRFIEVATDYGSDAGTAIETVMQDILNDWTSGPTSLFTPTSPGFLVTTTPYDGISVLDALQGLAALIGYTVRETWDDGTSAFRLTFAEPDRTPAAVDYTFGPNDYVDVTQLDISRDQIRNVVRVNYYDASGDPQNYTASDATSIARYGRRYFEINEDQDSPIDTAAEAQALADAALADLKEPVATQEIEARFFWPVQLGDYLRFSANGVHYSVDQDLAVVSVQHVLEDGDGSTFIRVRGKPAGFSRYWRTRAVTDADPDDPQDGIEWIGYHNHTEIPSRIGLDPSLRSCSLRGMADPDLVSFVDVWTDNTPYTDLPSRDPDQTLAVFDTGEFYTRTVTGRYAAARPRRKVAVAPAASPSAAWSLIHTANAAETTHQDADVEAGTTYEYYAVHLDGVDEGLPSNADQATTPGSAPAPAAIFAPGRARLNIQPDGHRQTNSHEIVKRDNPAAGSWLQFGIRCRIENDTTAWARMQWRDGGTGGLTGGYGFRAEFVTLVQTPDQGYVTHWMDQLISLDVDDVRIWFRVNPADPPVNLRWQP